jgi:hypothetical protein
LAIKQLILEHQKKLCMETKIKNSFKAVDFMRQVRNELSDLYHSDKESYYRELKKSMADFVKVRKKPATNKNIAASGTERC